MTTQTARKRKPTAIRRWMFENQVELQELARRLGIGLSHMGRVADGKANPGTDLLLLLSSVTGLTTDAILQPLKVGEHPESCLENSQSQGDSR